MAGAAQDKILVIKTGALGDFIQALGPMAAIRRHHPEAAITLLTTKPFVSFGEACGYFDHIMLDPRPRGLDAGAWAAWRRILRVEGFTRVYDLQNSERTALYSWLLFPRRPEWVGHAPLASHRNASPARRAGHAFDGHVQTLAGAGIEDVVIDDLSWVKADTERFALARPYVLLVPGCAPAHPEKRWPAASYGMLAQHLLATGILPVIIGTVDEAVAADIILAACPGARSLLGQTSLFDIVGVARNAHGAIGNDTGPIHLIAATGCPTLALFSQRSDPVRARPKGRAVRLLRRDDLAQLDVAGVVAALEDLQAEG